MRAARGGHSVLLWQPCPECGCLPGGTAHPQGPAISSVHTKMPSCSWAWHATEQPCTCGPGLCSPVPSVCLWHVSVSEIHSECFLSAEREMFCFTVNRRLSPKMPVSSWAQTATGIRIAHDRVIDNTLHSFQNRHIKLPAIYPCINLRESFQYRQF